MPRSSGARANADGGDGLQGRRADEELLPHGVTVSIYGVDCRCLGLQALIQAKRAAGRPKDLEAIAELEALLEERRSAEGA